MRLVPWRRTRARPPRSAPRPVSPGQYRRRRLAAALAVLLLAVGLGLTGRVLLYDLGLADVTQVEVTGAAVIHTREVLEAAAVPPGGPLAAVDVAGVAGRVARMPAVESVRVGRGWPHTVQVAITERVHYVPSWADVPAVVAAVARSGDLVITMGAGDVTVLAPEILLELERREQA